jgi:hypothetical protein
MWPNLSNKENFEYTSRISVAYNSNFIIAAKAVCTVC